MTTLRFAILTPGRGELGVTLPRTKSEASKRSDELNRAERERRDARDRELAELERTVEESRRQAQAGLARRSAVRARFNVVEFYRARNRRPA
jgi:hypothetical protein